MRRFPGNPVEEFEELRRLLLSREREQLRDLRDRISNKERRSRDVSGVLPEALKRSREHPDELARALRPAVEGSIKESIETGPHTLVDLLHPIIGPIMRRSMAERFRRLLQSRSLVYRVEQVFLIHRETSLSLLHVTADSAIARNSGMVAEMLSAVQDFARNSFEPGKNGALKEFHAGDLKVWIAPGRHVCLAAVIRGDPPRDLQAILEQTVEDVQVRKGAALANPKGDTITCEPLRPELEACLRTQYVSKSSRGRRIAAWTALGGATAVAICALVLAARSQARWGDFLGRLNAQPGIVVTETRQGWFSPSEVTGLRDNSSVDPAAIAVAAKLDPAKLRFHWKEFLALDPTSVQKRFADRFGIPPGLNATITDGVLTLSGSAPYEWLEGVRREASQIPGIFSLAERDLAVIHNPNSVLKRFEDKFTLPNTVRVVLVKSTVILSGKASHVWLTQVRSNGTSIPGISAVEEQQLVDLDQQAFQQSKSILENAFIDFVVDKEDIATESFVTLSILPNELRRCETAAERLDQAVVLEINGYADSINQRRALKVRDFFVSCGFDPSRLPIVGTDAPTNAAIDDPTTPKQLEGRVAFKVRSTPGP